MQRHILVAALLLGGCGSDDSGGGGSSGVDSAKLVKDLTPAERTAECQWGIATEGGAGKSTNCPDNVTVTVQTQAQCEACSEAIATEPCGGIASTACAAVAACAQ